jgi:tRNA threonylcarbamoyladenosine biosynthesis protein TsaB
MNLLAIETSSPALSVAIKKCGTKLRHAAVRGYMKHAENLLPVIDRLLKKEKLKIADIDAFLISRGPGSFTGLRIGFATLKGLLAIRSKPCYGASSLDVIAAGINTLQRPGLCIAETRSLKGRFNLTVCLDARRGKLYARSYVGREKRWIPSGPPRVVSVKEMDQGLPKGSWIAGDGTQKFDPKGLGVLPEKDWTPRASALIKLFEAGDPLLKKLKHPKEFLPAYLRVSEAEEKLRERKHQ